MIRTIFRLATSRIHIEGTAIIPVPMFETLDGKDHGDYEQRVEPSVQGGKKMGADFVRRLQAWPPAVGYGSTSAAPGTKAD